MVIWMERLILRIQEHPPDILPDQWSHFASNRFDLIIQLPTARRYEHILPLLWRSFPTVSGVSSDAILHGYDGKSRSRG